MLGDETCVCTCQKPSLSPEFLYQYLNQVQSGEQDTKVNSSRPRYPWEEWECDTTETRNFTDTEAIINSEATDVELNSFLFDLERADSGNRRGVPDLNKRIEEYVYKEIHHLFDGLAKKHPKSFGNVKAHVVGSIGEGTKLGVYEEFDFIVELPQISEFLLQGYDKFKPTGPSDIDSIRDDLQEYLFSSLKPPWRKFPDYHTQYGHQRNVLCLTLNPESPYHNSINIYCDIVFCVFFWTTDNFESLCLNCKKLQKGNKIVYKLEDYSQQVSSLLEMGKLNKSVNSENIKRIYKMSKMVIRDLLPPLWCGKSSRFEPIIPSYWLKQILLYMMDEYPNSMYWQEEHLGVRVSQIISWICKCLAKRHITNYYVEFHDVLKYEESASISTDKFVKKRFLYVSSLVSLLKGGARGDNSALNSLRSLRKLTAQIKATVLLDAQLLCLSFHIKRFQRSDNCRELIQDFASMHLAGVIEILPGRDDLYILYSNTLYSQHEFCELFNCSARHHTTWMFAKCFPEDWGELYESLQRK